MRKDEKNVGEAKAQKYPPRLKRIVKEYRERFGELPKFEYNERYTMESVGKALDDALWADKPIAENDINWLGVVYHNKTGFEFPGWRPIPDTELNRKRLMDGIERNIVYMPDLGDDVLY